MHVLDHLEIATNESKELLTQEALADLKFEMEHKTLFDKEAEKLGIKEKPAQTLKDSISENHRLIERNRSLRKRAQRSEAHCRRLIEHIEKFIHKSTKRSPMSKVFAKWYGNESS